MKLFSRKEKCEAQPLREVLIREQLNIIEDKLDYLIKEAFMATQAYTDLTTEVGVAVNVISNLAAQIAAHVVGTPDADLAVLTGQLKVATDAVAAVLTPPVVPAA